MYHFCTIITENYIPFAKGLEESLKEIGYDFQLHCLVLSENQIPDSEGNIVYQTFNNIKQNEMVTNLYKKYGNTDPFRWSLKPIFINYVLLNHSNTVVYIDPDINFFSDYRFIFEKLETANVILTLHHRSFNPYLDPVNFEKNFNEGFFNAGFLGVSKNGISSMDKFASMCLYKCEVDKRNGLYVDQKYLDLLFVTETGFEILNHPGCNVAEWNRLENRRSENDGVVKINDEYPIVFVHFTPFTIYAAMTGEDPHLESFVKIYSDRIIKFHPEKHNVISAAFDYVQNKKGIKKKELPEKGPSIFSKLKNHLKN